MALERDQIIEIVTSISGVLLILIALIFIGSRYGENGQFGESGGLMLVLAVGLLVLVMAIIGFGLAFIVSEPGEQDETADGESEPSDQDETTDEE